jgi:cell division protein FtsB
MKTKISKITFFTFAVMLLAFFGCENKSKEIEALTQENTDLKADYENQLLKTKKLTREVDSLKTVIYDLQSQVEKLSATTKSEALSPEEKAVHQLVMNIHRGWEKMFETKDTNELLKYFLPKYTTNALRINTENIPSVQRSNDANFEDHLRNLIDAGNVSVSFGETKFLYTEIKGNIFVTSYRTKLRVYQDNKEVYTSSLITLLAGANKDGWKVGNYSWVNLNYE